MEFDLENQVDDYELEKELKKFNWGAFGFSWIWGLFNGARSKVLLNILILLIAVYTYVEMKNLLCTGFVLFIFCITAIVDGYQGNRWAWYGTRAWEDFDAFVASQKRWAKAALILFLIGSYAAGSYVIYAYHKYNTTEVSPYGRGKIISENYVKKIVGFSDEIKPQCGKDIVDILMEEYKNSEMRNRKIVRNTSSMFRVESAQYITAFSFYKEPDCDLAKKNCFIYYYEGTQDSPAVAYSKTYYDDAGNVKTVMIK